jgi:hypothetical protein
MLVCHGHDFARRHWLRRRGHVRRYAGRRRLGGPDRLRHDRFRRLAGQGFGVAMPGKATKSSMTIAVVNAPTTIWTYIDESGRAFQVARSKFPKEALTGTSKAVLDNVAQDLPSSAADSTVESQVDVTIDGHAGRRYLQVSPKSNVEGVFVVAGDFVFTIYVTYEPGKADPGLLEAFLASFKLSI